jgi:protocatechuate 3,4-dioxygenase alpha subunit
MNDLLPTPSQTVGPFFHFALDYPGGPELVPGHVPNAIRLHGTVFDGAQNPVPDALLEIWQSDAAGTVSRQQGSLARDGFTFTGFGRSATTRAGHYQFTTVRPGGPFACLAVFARGLNRHLYTRVYFDAAAGGLLDSLPAERRSTLVAVPDAPRSFRFDIHLQGDGETVFLEFP